MSPKAPMQPMYDKVLIKPHEPETVTKGGIVLPDVAQERHHHGEVVVTGPGYRMDDGETQALTVQPGDQVLYAKYGGASITIEHQDYILISERDIHGVLPNDGAELPREDKPQPQEQKTTYYSKLHEV